MQLVGKKKLMEQEDVRECRFFKGLSKLRKGNHKFCSLAGITRGRDVAAVGLGNSLGQTESQADTGL